MRSFMILILRNYNSRDQTEDNIGRAHGTYMGRGKCKGVVGKLKENRGIDRRIILNWTLKKKMRGCRLV